MFLDSTKNQALLTTLGFIIAGLGFVAILLSMVGLEFAFLAWLDGLGGFLVKIAMVLVGFMMIYLGQTDFSGEEDEFTES